MTVIAETPRYFHWFNYFLRCFFPCSVYYYCHFLALSRPNSIFGGIKMATFHQFDLCLPEPLHFLKIFSVDIAVNTIFRAISGTSIAARSLARIPTKAFPLFKESLYIVKRAVNATLRLVHITMLHCLSD